MSSHEQWIAVYCARRAQYTAIHNYRTSRASREGKQATGDQSSEQANVEIRLVLADMFKDDFVGRTGGARGKRVGLSVGKRARVPRGYVQVLYDIQMNVLSVGKWKGKFSMTLK